MLINYYYVDVIKLGTEGRKAEEPNKTKEKKNEEEIV